MAAYGALWWGGEEDQGYFSLAVLFFPSCLCVLDFLLLYDGCEKKSLRRKLDSLALKKVISCQDLLPNMGPTFSASFSVLMRMSLWIFFCFLCEIRELSLTVLVALSPFQSVYVCLIFSFCFCRTRCWIILNAAAVANSVWWPSLKRRRTTKIRSLTVAWDCRVPSLLIHCIFLSHQCGHTTTCSWSVSSHILSCFICICLFLQV